MKNFADILSNFVIEVIKGADINEVYEKTMDKHYDEMTLIEVATIEFYSYMLLKHPTIVKDFINKRESAEILLELMFESWRMAKKTEWKKQEWYHGENVIMLPVPEQIYLAAQEEIENLKTDTEVIEGMTDHLQKKFGIDKEVINHHVINYWRKSHGWIKSNGEDP